MPKHLLSRLAAALISAAGTLAMAQTPSPTSPAPATTAAVTFATAEDDAGYRVLLGTTGTSGAVIGSASVQPGSLATGGFTVQVSSPPGAGKSVTAWWLIVR